MPLQETSGNVTADAYGGGVAAIPNYIEDCFSSYLYTGNGSTQTITNGIDLAGKGGMVWVKSRSAATNHKLTDTVRGATKSLLTNNTDPEITDAAGLTAFGAAGFTLGSNTDYNNSAATYVGWSFRKQAKFFDCVTYTGNGTGGRTVSHNLGSEPGFMIVKNITTSAQWLIYHRSLGNTKYLLFTTDAAGTGSFAWNNTSPTSTEFTVGTSGACNTNGDSYVAYIFAHNAGGFGLTGTDNVISCGSFTPDGSGNATIDLGWEPQWLLRKTYNNVGDWEIRDSMRDFSMSSSALLYPNYSLAETAGAAPTFIPTATGFKYVNGGTQPMIYIAIRRGPMKVPTDATKVFAPVKVTATSTTTVTTNFPVDSCWNAEPNAVDSGFKYVFDRLRGGSTTQYDYLITSSTNAEAVGGTAGLGFQSNVSVVDRYWGTAQGATSPIIYWNFQRAPSFFDEVCYTGNGTAGRTIQHNLAVVPELMIHKCRSATAFWGVYASGAGISNYLVLNTTAAGGGVSLWNDTLPTASVFTVGSGGAVNTPGDKYVAYLFATCAGVSKVFSFTGNGTTQTINCGFTGGARFVLLKATSTTGGWYVYDTARGMTTLTDPYLFLNSTAAESATLGSVTTVTTGFAVNESVLAGVNTSGVSYIGLAIA